MNLQRLFFIILLGLSLALNAYLFIALQDANAARLIALFSSGKNKVEQSGKYLNSTGVAVIPPDGDLSSKTTSTDIKTLSTTRNDKDNRKIIKEIKALIRVEAYFEAMTLFVDFRQTDINAALILKNSWLQDIGALIEIKSFATSELFLQAYLYSYPDDIEFLSLQVDFYLAKKQIILAVQHAYDIIYHVFDYQDKADYITSARSLVQEEANRLLVLKSWSLLADFCQQVLSLDAEFYHLQLLLARAEYQLNRLRAAENNVRPLLANPQLANEAQILLDKIESANQAPTLIPLMQQGKHYIVEGLINEDYSVALMLDTGASISLLSQTTFERLGLDREAQYVKDIRLNTAGGVVNSSIYQVSIFEINGYFLENMHFAVSPYFSSDHDGLLGMNYLAHFNFYIDQSSHALQLEPKSP